MLLYIFYILLQACLSGTQWYNGTCGVSKYTDAGRNLALPFKAFLNLYIQPKNKFPQIVNGWKARPYEFPWQALLFRDGIFICGAVIINPRNLLTAAHCTSSIQWYQTVTVVVGENDRTSENPVRREYEVTRILDHPQYNTQGELENDISILFTESEIEFNENITAACRPDGSYAGSTAITAGYGQLEYNRRQSSVLLYARNPIMRNKECKTCFPKPSDIQPGMICYGYCGTNKQSTCQGDSGGPAVVKNNSSQKFQLIGLTSFAYTEICLSSFPIVFTNVSFFTEWVDKNIIKQF